MNVEIDAEKLFELSDNLGCIDPGTEVITEDKICWLSVNENGETVMTSTDDNDK